MLIRSVVIIHHSCMIFLFSLFHLDFTLLFSALRGVYQLRWPFQMTSFGFVNILHCVSSFDFTDFCSFLYCSLFVLQFSSVQSLSRVWLFATPWIAAHQASLSITNSRNLLKLMPIESVMPSSHLILCHPLTLVLFWSSFSSSNLNEWFRHFFFYTITS